MTKIIADDFTISKADKKNYLDTVIERSNLSNTFTLRELEEDLVKLERQARELEGQVKVSSAAIANINHNHPFVSKLSDEQLQTAAYIYETKDVLRKAETGLKANKAAKKKYKEVIDTVVSKFGFKDETTE